MTLYVESNFVLEIALGQEELAPAERLLAAAEAGTIVLATPSFSLSEPFARVTRGIRDRGRLRNQLNAQVDQLARSTPHQTEVVALQAVPGLFAAIDKREEDRLTGTVERLLATARLIPPDLPTFRAATDYRDRYGLDIQDAIVLASVVADLKTLPLGGTHLLANRNKKDFNDPGIFAELRRLGCEIVWTFADAVRLLGMR